MRWRGWLLNALVQVVFSYDRTRQGAFLARILGRSRSQLMLTVPMQAGSAAWAGVGARLELLFPGEQGAAVGGRQGEGHVLPVRVTDRGLKPVPHLLVEPQGDVPLLALRKRKRSVIAVTSGKGGTGKTTVSVNLGYCALRRGQRAVVFDGDLGTGDVALLLRTDPEVTLGDVLEGRALIEDTLLTSGGLSFVPGLAGADGPVEITPWKFCRLLEAVSILEQQFDLVIIDTGAGVGYDTANLLLTADLILLVLNDTPTSALDAYSVLKIVAGQKWVPQVALVINRAMLPGTPEKTARRFCFAAAKHLGLPVEFLGIIREDRAIEEALRRGRTILPPDSPAVSDMELVFDRLLQRDERKQTGSAI